MRRLVGFSIGENICNTPKAHLMFGGVYEEKQGRSLRSTKHHVGRTIISKIQLQTNVAAPSCLIWHPRSLPRAISRAV